MQLINAINEDKTVYTENSGILPLRKEISKYLMNKGIDYSPDEICITVGGSEAIFTIFTALINRGDKVLIPTPAYPAYEYNFKNNRYTKELKKPIIHERRFECGK